MGIKIQPESPLVVAYLVKGLADSHELQGNFESLIAAVEDDIKEHTFWKASPDELALLLVLCLHLLFPSKAWHHCDFLRSSCSRLGDPIGDVVGSLGRSGGWRQQVPRRFWILLCLGHPSLRR